MMTIVSKVRDLASSAAHAFAATAETPYDAMTGPEQVAAYNALAAEIGLDPVERFSDRKAGARRCVTLAARVAEVKNGTTTAAKVAAVTEGRASEEVLRPAGSVEDVEADAAAAEAARDRANAAVVQASIIDAHVKEIEAKGADVVRLGAASDQDMIMSTTSKGALLTRLGEGGALAHEWETQDAPARAAPKAPREAKRAARTGGQTARQSMTVAALGAGRPRPGSVGEKYFDKMVGRTVGEYLALYDEGHDRKYAGAWLGHFLTKQPLVKLEAK